jgi:hypothetical protein
MAEYLLSVAPLMWPHLLLVLVTAVLAVRSRSLAQSLAIAAAAAVLVAAFYWLTGSQMAPDQASQRPGQLVALLLAGLLPLVAAAGASYLAKRKGTPLRVAALLGAVVGVLLLVPMPIVQLALGCAFTGVCL